MQQCCIGNDLTLKVWKIKSWRKVRKIYSLFNGALILGDSPAAKEKKTTRIRTVSNVHLHHGFVPQSPLLAESILKPPAASRQRTCFTLQKRLHNPSKENQKIKVVNSV
jgi:hypothetical protein